MTRLHYPPLTCTWESLSLDNPSLRIRPMTIGDIERVHLIDQLSFSLPWPVKSYQFELNENPNSLSWVAEFTLPDGSVEIEGMIVVWLVVDEAHIATLAVHPEKRGLGIGKKLLATALEETIPRGTHSATLEVRDGNLAAQQLYRQFGFTIVGRRTHYYRGNNEDAIIMTINGLDQNYLNWMKSHLVEVEGER